MVQVANEVHEETVELGLTLKNPLALGILGTAQGKQHTFRLQANLWFPQVCTPITALTLLICAAAKQLQAFGLHQRCIVLD